MNSYTTLYFIAFVKPYAQYMQWTRMAWFDAQTSYLVRCSPSLPHPLLCCNLSCE